MAQTHADHISPSSGIVYLVGAGPGDPGLITVKGLTVLRLADVVIYDYLANPVLLDEARADAEKIYVGKSASNHTMSQQEINQLLIEHALAGKIVVRLKGGDPFVFGRGGEEAEALIRHGIRWEVIPGVTSAIAVPAYAGIPVTHREYASLFTVVTGSDGAKDSKSELDWEALARLHSTLVFLMGVSKLPFIVQQLRQAGCHESTPVAVVRRGSLPDQQTVTGTLSTIVELVQQAQVKPPAVIVVGEVAQLAEQLHWFNSTAILNENADETGK